MRRWTCSTLLAVFLCLLLAAPAQAAASLTVRSADVRSVDGQSLSVVEKDRPVRLVAILRNVGDETHNGIVVVVFDVSGPAGPQPSRPVPRGLTVGPNQEVEASLDWTPTEAGKHQLRVSLQNQPGTTYVTNFTVGEAEVERAELWERFVSYGWFYGTFLGIVVLFAAVVRHRKPRS